MPIVRVPWSSASFLLYTGGLTVLVSASALLGVLEGDYRKAAFAGWSALVYVVLATLAFAAQSAGRRVVAGLFALSAVVAVVVFVGALLDWAGWLHNHGSGPFAGFSLGNLLLELVALVASIVALRRFRFPLLALFAAATSWFFVTDLVSGGGNWSAWVSIFVGVVLLGVALAVDRVYGFWVHVVAGLTIGGAFLFFWHQGNRWLVLGIAALAFVWFAGKVGRSSYAVLGTIGLFLATSHYIEKWFGGFAIPFVSFGESSGRPWARALSYAVFGLFLMLLGLWLARREPDSEASH